MATLRILIPEVLGTASGEAVAASQASASLADDNLLTPELWEKWRSESNDPADCCGYGHIKGDPEFYCNGVALAGLNMVPANGEVMVVTLGESGTITLPGFEEVLPASVFASSGITGAIGDVNEGSGASDAAYITPTTVDSSFVTFAFNAPSASPRTGTKRQAFWLRLTADQDTTGAFAYRRPTVTAKLYEDVAGVSVFRANLGTKAVHGVGLCLIFFSWDATNLATANGSKVHLRLEFEKVETSVSPRVDSVWWTCESNQISGATNIVRETGWHALLGEVASTQNVDYAPQRGEFRTRWSYKFEDVPDTVRRVYFFLREDHTPVETSTSLNRFLLRPPPGYVQAGRFAAGVWWSPEINRAQGQFMAINDPSSVVEDEDGGRFGSRREPYDDLRISLEFLTTGEYAWLRQRLIQDMGTLSPFYIELEPDSVFEVGAGGWAKLISNSVQVSRRNADQYPYSLEFAVRIQR